MTLVGKLNRVHLLVNNEEQLVRYLRHTTVIIRHIDILGLLHLHLDTLLREELDEWFILWQALVCTIGQQTALLHLAIGSQLSSLGNEVCNEVLLQTIQILDNRTVLLEELILALRHRTRNNERCTRIVNQDRIDLIDNCEVVLALHQIGRRRRHIITQVVETILVICSEGDICKVGIATLLRIRLVRIDTVNRQAVELIHRTHPLGITLCKVVVHGNHMNTLACQRIQEYGQCSHEGLTLSRSHLGNLTLMQYHSTEELNIVVNHIPLDIVSACGPMGRIDCIVALDIYKIFAGSEVAVEVVCRNHHCIVLRKSTSRILHDSESLGENLIENLLDLLVDTLYGLVDILRNLLLLIERDIQILQLRLLRYDMRLVLCDKVGNALTQSGTMLTQLIVRQRLDSRINSFDFIDIRLNLLAILISLAAEEKLNYTC